MPPLSPPPRHPRTHRPPAVARGTTPAHPRTAASTMTRGSPGRAPGLKGGPPHPRHPPRGAARARHERGHNGRPSPQPTPPSPPPGPISTQLELLSTTGSALRYSSLAVPPLRRQPPTRLCPPPPASSLAPLPLPHRRWCSTQSSPSPLPLSLTTHLCQVPPQLHGAVLQLPQLLHLAALRAGRGHDGRQRRGRRYGSGGLEGRGGERGVEGRSGRGMNETSTLPAGVAPRGGVGEHTAGARPREGALPRRGGGADARPLGPPFPRKYRRCDEIGAHIRPVLAAFFRRAFFSPTPRAAPPGPSLSPAAEPHPSPVQAAAPLALLS